MTGCLELVSRDVGLLDMQLIARLALASQVSVAGRSSAQARGHVYHHPPRRAGSFHASRLRLGRDFGSVALAWKAS